MFLRNGDSVLAPDNRGHGRSGGVVTYGVREAGDIAAWQAWLTARGIRHCFGFGESLGASALLQSLSSGAAFTAIVAECPFASFGRVGWDRVMHVLKHLLPPPVARPVSDLLVTEVLLYLRLRYGVDLALARSVDAVKNITTRILLIHGMADYETPVHHSQEIAAANPNIQLWLVPDAKHTGGYPVQPVEFERRVMDLMKPGDDAE
jgi:pimeloyl-ACP methyl ester carboxylesterase